MPSSHMRFHVKVWFPHKFKVLNSLVNFVTHNTFHGLENSKFQVHCAHVLVNPSNGYVYAFGTHCEQKV
jgi:hypothetical protein